MMGFGGVRGVSGRFWGGGMRGGGFVGVGGLI